MKKKILLLLLLAMMVFSCSLSAFAAEPELYTVTTSLSNLTSSGSATVAAGADYSATLTADSGYALPESITVKVAETELTAGSGYTYDSSTGALSIPAASVIGNISITAVGVDSRLPDVSMKVTGDEGGTYLSSSSFDAATKSYSLEIDEDEEMLELYVYFDEDDYKVTVKYDGSTVSVEDEYSSYYYYEFDVDTDDLGTLKVTVRDRDTYESTIYSIYLDGSSGGADELKDIEVNIGSAYKSSSSYQLDLLPSFDEEQNEYIVLVPNEDGDSSENFYVRIKVDSDAEVSSSTLRYLSSTSSYDYYGGYVNILDGDSETVSFTVGGYTYYVKIYFADEDADDSAELSKMFISSRQSTSSSYQLELSPEFDADETDYSVADADDYSKLYLYVKADSDRMIFIEDGKVSSGSYWKFDPDDYDELEVVVYAEDLEEYTKYTIDLDETANSLLSLRAYSGSGAGISISPSFSSNVYNYTANVDNSVSAITLHLSAGATIQVAKDGGAFTAKSSSSTYTLKEGLNEFDILVGSTHYYLNVYRAALSTSIVPSTQYISINGGAAVAIPAYNINGNNFVKLRSVAYLLSGTSKQFAVSYNEASRMVNLNSGYAYTSIGGEMTIPTGYTKAVVCNQSIVLNSNYVYPTAYNIDGNNYFLLRDLAALFDFAISYSGSTVSVDTSKSYGGESTSTSASSSSTADWDDVSMKISGDGGAYLSKSEFDVDEDEYEIEMNDETDELYLYVYCDPDDFAVSVEYDDADIDGTEYSTYYRFSIDADLDDADELYVTIEDENNNEEVYTIYLDGSSSSGDWDDISMRIIGDGGTYLAKRDFDVDETSYDITIDDDTDDLYLYVYCDPDDFSVSVEYDGDTLDGDEYASYYRFSIDADLDDADEIYVSIEDDHGEEEYTIYLDK